MELPSEYEVKIFGELCTKQGLSVDTVTQAGLTVDAITHASLHKLAKSLGDNVETLRALRGAGRQVFEVATIVHKAFGGWHPLVVFSLVSNKFWGAEALAAAQPADVYSALLELGWPKDTHATRLVEVATELVGRTKEATARDPSTTLQERLYAIQLAADAAEARVNLESCAITSQIQMRRAGLAAEVWSVNRKQVEQEIKKYKQAKNAKPPKTYWYPYVRSETDRTEVDSIVYDSAELADVLQGVPVWGVPSGPAAA